MITRYFWELAFTRMMKLPAATYCYCAESCAFDRKFRQLLVQPNLYCLRHLLLFSARFNRSKFRLILDLPKVPILIFPPLKHSAPTPPDHHGKELYSAIPTWRLSFKVTCSSYRKQIIAVSPWFSIQVEYLLQVCWIRLGLHHNVLESSSCR